MTSLKYSKTSVVATWIYCLLWFIVQDAIKVFTYWVMDRYFKSDADKAIEEHAIAHSAEALAAHAAEVEASRQATIEASKAASGISAANVAAAESAGVMGTIGRAVATIGRSTREIVAPSTARTAYSGTTSANNTVGRNTVGRTANYFPAGIDLTAIARAAAQETVRLREKTIGRAATSTASDGAASKTKFNLADLASGAAAASYQQAHSQSAADSNESEKQESHEQM